MNTDHNRVFIIQVYRESDLQEEKTRVSRALGNVQSQALIQRILDFSLSVSLQLQLKNHGVYLLSILRITG